MEFSQIELVGELTRVIGLAEASRIRLRAIGGLAVQMHTKNPHPVFIRDYPDLDLVVARKQRREFESFMPEAGYDPHKQFNILNGTNRQIYYHQTSEMKIDVFVGDFEMCHKIPLEDRLSFDPLTIPLAELLLSKAQIVELNRKDALDIAAILLYNETGRDDNGKVNLDHIAHLCSQDWGLYKTTEINLQRVGQIINGGDVDLTNEERAVIHGRIRQLYETFENMPKSMQWKMRDKVGTRVRWYEEVEEVRR